MRLTLYSGSAGVARFRFLRRVAIAVLVLWSKRDSEDRTQTSFRPGTSNRTHRSWYDFSCVLVSLLKFDFMNQSTATAVSPSVHRFGKIVVVAILSWLTIVACIDPGGSYPQLPEGPGLTIDEIFNVEQGVYLVEQARSLGWLNLVPGTSQEAYRPNNGIYNPDHPPLGRWWLGVHHHLTWWLFPPHDPEGSVVTACARTGSATAFALTVFLVGCFATRWSGQSAGLMTAISLVLMPRLFGHAHLASLETITNLTCSASVLVVADWWSGPSPPTRRAAIAAGLFLGLALLTKIQAVLIPIPVVAWGLWRWRTSVIVPLILWGTTALIVFFVLWPFLWFDPLGNGLAYLGRATNRSIIQVWYFGQKFSDKEVPWHYPFVMFGLTIPVVLNVLGFVALWPRSPTQTGGSLERSALDQTRSTKKTRGVERSSVGFTSEQCGARDLLLLACMAFPLIVFAIPGVAVYDGERLFLTSFPLWSFFVGRGWKELERWISNRVHSHSTARLVSSVLLLLTALPLMDMSPCHLGYYNQLSKLIPGTAESKTMMEVDYWGVGVTRTLLKTVVQSVPEGASVAVLPTLHQFQADEYRRQSPILRAHGVKTVEYRPDSIAQEYELVFCRLADLPEVWKRPKPELILGEIIRGGHRFAYLYRRDNLPAAEQE